MMDHLIYYWAPVSTLLIMPIFALANTGVVVDLAIASQALTAPIGLGIVSGLVIGKPIGITLFSLASIKLGRRRRRRRRRRKREECQLGYCYLCTFARVCRHSCHRFRGIARRNENPSSYYCGNSWRNRIHHVAVSDFPCVPIGICVLQLGKVVHPGRIIFSSNGLFDYYEHVLGGRASASSSAAASWGLKQLETLHHLSLSLFGHRSMNLFFFFLKKRSCWFASPCHPVSFASHLFKSSRRANSFSVVRFWICKGAVSVRAA